MKKIVLIRLDKIGDLISTLSSDQVSFLQGANVTWVIAQGLGFIPKNAVPLRKFIELNKNEAKVSFWKLVHFLKSEKPDIAVSFQAPWWVSLALWMAKVPVRAGVKSQWHSFIFLNKGLRQKRSEARQHEADYNTDLLAFACGELEKRLMNQKTTQGVSYLSPYLSLAAPALDLKFWNLENKKYLIVHPGMAGSALNWPEQKYIDLISFLVKDHQVVLTGTVADEPWLAQIKKVYAGHPRVLNLQSKLSGTELLAVISGAKVVIAPSTGVAHLAAALKTPVVALFSPVPVQHPRRWAPRGENIKILLPNITDKKKFKDPSSFDLCMDLISVNQVLQEVKNLQEGL